jgi:hypothetical protein
VENSPRALQEHIDFTAITPCNELLFLFFRFQSTEGKSKIQNHFTASAGFSRLVLYTRLPTQKTIAIISASNIAT